MATPKIVPRAKGEGSLGAAAYGWGGLYITSTTTSAADEGGNIALSTDDGNPMGSGHRLGILEFKGAEDTSGTLTTGASIQALTDATWSDTENGAYLSFYTTDGNASQTETMQILNSGIVKIMNGHLLQANTGNGSVISESTAASGSTSGGRLQLRCDDGAAMGSGHRLGVIEFKGAEDASNNKTIGARIECMADAAWSATENGGRLDFYTTDANASEGLALRLDSDKLARFGGNIIGPTDGDFTVSSDGSMVFQLDADDDETSQSFSFVNTETEVANLTESGGLQVDADIKASGGAVIGLNYRTIYVDAGGMVPAVTNGAQAVTEEMHATNFTTMDYLAFDKATEEYADFKLVMPEQYDNGTVKVKFYWKPSDAETDVSVIWGIKAYAATEDGTLAGGSGVWGTAQEIESTDHSTGNLVDDDLYISSATPAMTIAGTPAEGKLVFFRVYRKAADGTDDYDADAHLLGVNIQYREQATSGSAAW